MLNDDGAQRLALAVLQQAVADLPGPFLNIGAALGRSCNGAKTSMNRGAREQKRAELIAASSRTADMVPAPHIGHSARRARAVREPRLNSSQPKSTTPRSLRRR